MHEEIKCYTDMLSVCTTRENCKTFCNFLSIVYNRNVCFVLYCILLNFGGNNEYKSHIYRTKTSSVDPSQTPQNAAS